MAKDVMISLKNLDYYHGTIQSKIDGLTWSGTQADLDNLIAQGKLPEGCQIVVTDDYEQDDYYTKKEVDSLIGSFLIPQFSVDITEDHTQISNPKANVIYLEKGISGQTLFSEWIYLNNKWQSLGAQQINTYNVSDDGTIYL